MNALMEERKAQAIKCKRLVKAFEGVRYNFFAQWDDTDRLAKEVLGTDINTILP